MWEFWGQDETHLPLAAPEQTPEMHCVPVVQGCWLFSRQAAVAFGVNAATKVLPGAQMHAFCTGDHVAPMPAGQVHVEDPGVAALAPGPQSVHGATPPGP